MPRVPVPKAAFQFPSLGEVIITTAPGITLSFINFVMMGRSVAAYAGSVDPFESGDLLDDSFDPLESFEDSHPAATTNPTVATSTPKLRRFPMTLRPGPLIVVMKCLPA
ncbi:hypothetical protein GCM10027262_32280 [Nocardia tengchongensis]